MRDYTDMEFDMDEMDLDEMELDEQRAATEILGVRATWDTRLDGVRIVSVDPAGPSAGTLRSGDVITHYSFDGRRYRSLRSVREFRRVVEDLYAAGGGLIFLAVLRRGRRPITVRLSIRGDVVILRAEPGEPILDSRRR